MTILILTFFVPLNVVADITDTKTNIIIFLVDDPGYADFGFQGSTRIKTPNIDHLANEGVRFTNGYSTGCVCTPSRAGLLTGRYPQRFGLDSNAVGKPLPTDKGPRALDSAQKTIATRLKAYGYATALFGKWHLGDEPQYLPTSHGFDEFVGVLGSGISHKKIAAQKKRGEDIFYRGQNAVPLPENPMETYCQESVSFIARNKSKPFFLFLPFTHVHGPSVGAKPYIDAQDQNLPISVRKYLADIAETDAVVGRVMAALRENGVEENTFVFFLGDNGGAKGNYLDNGVLRGTKWFLWEGGIRVPFLIYAKGQIQGGQVFDHPVINLDIARTIFSVIDIEVDPVWKLDGADLLPILRNKNNIPPHDALFWRYGVQYAVRRGDWKLVKPSIDDRPHLYNLKTDISETNNLALHKPEKVQELQTLWETWNNNNEPERWYDARTEGKGGNKKNN
ncbi:MAG: sulfatase-like hydrolase/transferase, partial [Planctomycetaceae bacterium]|nr:sulfatase-like hydrolase/transferase [Planctomycetaceae bacterium]